MFNRKQRLGMSLLRTDGLLDERKICRGALNASSLSFL